MSTLVMDVRPIGRGHGTGRTFDAILGRTHPRGQGFRVLSRIARVNADDPDYAPRHRRDVQPDVDVRSSIAG